MPEHVTPSVAKDLLRRHRLRAGRRFGQHFLVDPNTVRRIVRLAELQPDATVLEIGPGLGSLTVALSAAAKRVVAVEVDGRVAEALTEVVGGLRNVDVVVGDALEVDLGALAGAGARLVSNLPYNVATPILMRVLERVPQITGGLVMTQRELGRRWVAGPGDPDVGAVSLRVAYHARARIIGDVPATVFLPPPKVSSVLVAFERHDPPVDVTDEASFFALVRDAFGRRRKTIRNSLVGAGWDTARIDAALADARIEPRQRPERLGLFDFARLHAALR